MRHTNALVIADRGFPFWPQIETMDISPVDDVPPVLQGLAAVCANHNFTQAYMAREFQKNNTTAVCRKFAKGLQGSRPNLNRTWNSRSACRAPSG